MSVIILLFLVGIAIGIALDDEVEVDVARCLTRGSSALVKEAAELCAAQAVEPAVTDIDIGMVIGADDARTSRVFENDSVDEDTVAAACDAAASAAAAVSWL